MQKGAFRVKNRFDLSEMENRCQTKDWTSKGSFGVPTFLLTRRKQGAKIDIGLALMSLNLIKLGKYMEKEET